MSSRAWAITLAVLIGVVFGVGTFTFVYARGYSYLGNDPAACANCHVMHEQYDGWAKSSHRAVATCNDCHTPANPVGKYYTKAKNGFWHSFYFTVGWHDPIQITPADRRITEGACRHCHDEMVDAIEHGGLAGGQTPCLRCHNSVGHPEGLGAPTAHTATRSN
jgi:cytochrome c nitrite reductase small subunit